MSFSIGIIGLPNVGKSTLFKALTKQKVDVANYPFCTIDPNVGIVRVPDERLEAIHKIVQRPKMIPTIIEFVDIAGLVKNAHKGEGLGNQFLAHIREVDALCHVVRAFGDKATPQNDIEIINTELVMKDLETVSKHKGKAKKQARPGNKELVQRMDCLKKFEAALNGGKTLKNVQMTASQENLAKELGLISAKPILYLFNTGDGNVKLPKLSPEQSRPAKRGGRVKGSCLALSLNLQLESDLDELSKEEQKELELEPSQLNKLIQACYEALDLVTFYTICGPEDRAWTARKGTSAPQAGGIIHSDFQEKFIKAEAIDWQALVEAGSWQTAREKGLIRTEGKNYLVRDGDVIEFKI